jgi:hypothetical protein
MSNDQILVSDTIGKVSCIIDSSDKPFAQLVLAHGAGAPMTHPFMKEIATGLANRGVRVIRYNFPYMEAKKKRPDVPAVAHQAVKAISDWAHSKYEKLPLFIGGKSFGGRMSSQWLAKEKPAMVRGICFFGFPLHPAGTPSLERADHLKEVQAPMLFHQGTRDALANYALVQQVIAGLPRATLITYEGADHSFKRGKEVPFDRIISTTVDWMKSIVNS